MKDEVKDEVDEVQYGDQYGGTQSALSSSQCLHALSPQSDGSLPTSQLGFSCNSGWMRPLLCLNV